MLSSYLTENTVCSHYKDQSSSAVQCNTGTLLWVSYGTYECTVRTKCRIVSVNIDSACPYL